MPKTTPLPRALWTVLICCLCGCTFPFHGPTLPEEEGRWVGQTLAVKVLDDGNQLHEVVAIQLTAPAINKPPPQRQELGFGRYSPSPQTPMFPLLVDRRGETVDAHSFSLLGRQVCVTGTLCVRDDPLASANGRPIVPREDAAIVSYMDGSQKREYTSQAQLQLRFTSIEPVSDSE